MRKIIIPLVVIVFFAATSFSNGQNVEKEKEAIMEVIKAQTQASSNRDFNLLTSYWLQDESAVRVAASKDGFIYQSGWKELQQAYKTGVKNNPEPSNNKKEYSDIKVKVYKESAWAVFKETTYNSDGSLNNIQIGTRFLEKVDGKWKIVYMTFIVTSTYEE